MYCPKCDMDFVEGVTICTDCGGDLVNKEEYMVLMEAQATERAAARAQEAREMLENMTEDDLTALTGRKKRMYVEEPATYVHQKDKYTDNKSSAIAFLVVGIILAALAVIAWLGIVKLGLPFNIATSFFAALCIVLALSSYAKANKLKATLGEEDDLRDNVYNTFIKDYTSEDVDAKIVDMDLSDEELALERLNVIQDMLTNIHDIPDASFAAEIAEDIYTILYE